MNIPTTRGIRRLARFASVALSASALSLRAADVARVVEYIQTDGSGSTVGEYVLLDYKPTASSFVEMDIMFLSQSANQTLFCARGSKTTSSTFTLFFMPGNGFRWDYNRTSAQYEAGFGVNERHVIRCGPTGFWTDGVKSDTIKVSPTSYTPANKMTLFASYTASTTATPVPADNWANLRLYSFKAWDDNGETRKVHLRPCVDTAGVAGLYDLVSGKIYYNKRSGKAFTVSDTDTPDTLIIAHGSNVHAVCYTFHRNDLVMNVPGELAGKIKTIDSYSSFSVGLSTDGKVYVWGIGKIGAQAMDAIARQPEAAGTIRTNMILTAAFVEGVALFAVVVCALCVFL